MVRRVLIAVVCLFAVGAVLPIVIITTSVTAASSGVDVPTQSILHLMPPLFVLAALAGIGIILVAHRKRTPQL